MRWRTIGRFVFFASVLLVLVYIATAVRHIQYRTNMLYLERVASNYQTALPICLEKAASLGYSRNEFDSANVMNLNVDFDQADSASTFKRAMQFTNSPSIYARQLYLIMDISRYNRYNNSLICLYDVSSGQVHFESERIESLPPGLQKEIQEWRTAGHIARDMRAKAER